MKRRFLSSCLALSVLTLSSCSFSYHAETRRSHHSVRICQEPGPGSAPVASDLNARFEAAQTITAFAERDKAMSDIARDAASLGEVEMMRKALGQVVSFVARDDAAAASAKTLKQQGNRTEAVAVARLITSFERRDEVMAELAK